MLVRDEQGTYAFQVVQLQCLAPRGHKPQRNGRQRASSIPLRLMLVGAEQGTSAFLYMSKLLACFDFILYDGGTAK